MCFSQKGGGVNVDEGSIPGGETPLCPKAKGRVHKNGLRSDLSFNIPRDKPPPKKKAPDFDQKELFPGVTKNFLPSNS